MLRWAHRPFESAAAPTIPRTRQRRHRRSPRRRSCRRPANPRAAGPVSPSLPPSLPPSAGAPAPIPPAKRTALRRSAPWAAWARPWWGRWPDESDDDGWQHGTVARLCPSCTWWPTPGRRWRCAARRTQSGCSTPPPTAACCSHRPLEPVWLGPFGLVPPPALSLSLVGGSLQLSLLASGHRPGRRDQRLA